MEYQILRASAIIQILRMMEKTVTRVKSQPRPEYRVYDILLNYLPTNTKGH